MTTKSAAEEFAASLSLDQLERNAQAALKARNDSLARICHDAIAIKRGERAHDSGTLREIVEPPCRENGNRYITRYEGDPMAWMAPFMRHGVTARVDYELAQKGAREETDRGQK